MLMRKAIINLVFLLLPAPAYASWQEWVETKDPAGGLIEAIELAAEETGVDPVDLAAMSYQESRCRHYDRGGGVKTGDNGLAIGVMQIHPLWVEYWRKELNDGTLTRYSLEDNVRMAAHILVYSGYFKDRMRAIGKYNGGHTPYKPYARSIDRISQEIRNYEEDEG